MSMVIQLAIILAGQLYQRQHPPCFNHQGWRGRHIPVMKRMQGYIPSAFAVWCAATFAFCFAYI